MDKESGVRIDIKTMIAAGSLVASVIALTNQYSSDSAKKEAEQDQRLCRLEALVATGDCKK